MRHVGGRTKNNYRRRWPRFLLFARQEGYFQRGIPTEAEFSARYGQGEAVGMGIASRCKCVFRNGVTSGACLSLSNILIREGFLSGTGPLLRGLVPARGFCRVESAQKFLAPEKAVATEFK